MTVHSFRHLTPDQLLTTTRSVRRRLDLRRPVELDVIRECIQVAIQAPSGSNVQNWHFLIVADPQKRKAVADLYREVFAQYIQNAAKDIQSNAVVDPVVSRTLQRINASALYLAEILHEVPVIIIPCIEGGSNPFSPARLENAPSAVQAASWGSIFPAVWSFMLAARARGLGTSLTTLHLLKEQEVASILNIPYETVTQVALIPTAYTLGSEFKPGSRKPVEQIFHVDSW